MASSLPFLPGAIVSLIAVVLGVGLLVGLIRPRAILGLLLLYPIIGAVFNHVVGALPGWLAFLLVAALVVSLLRAALSAVVGRGAMDHALGILIANAVLGCFRLLFLPLRLLARLLLRH